MSPRSAEQNEQIRHLSKQKILDAALVVFATKGFTNSTMASITKKAGVSKGLAYNYFENKDALLKEVFDDGFSKIEHLITGSFNSNPFQSLISIIDTTFTSFESDLTFWTLYIQATIQPDSREIISEQIEAGLKGIMGGLLQIFVTLKAEDPETEAFLFGAHFDGVLCDYMMTPDTYPLEKVKNLLIKRYTDLFKQS